MLTEAQLKFWVPDSSQWGFRLVFLFSSKPMGIEVNHVFMSSLYMKERNYCFASFVVHSMKQKQLLVR